MYFERPSRWLVYDAMDAEKALVIAASLFFVVFFFVYPSPLFLSAHKVALSLSL